MISLLRLSRPYRFLPPTDLALIIMSDNELGDVYLGDEEIFQTRISEDIDIKGINIGKYSRKTIHYLDTYIY